MAYDTQTVLYLTFELLVAALSIFGNALVTASFIRDRSLRTPTNLFVFSLAIADLLTSSVATPLYARSMLTKLPHHFRACICVHSLILTFCTVSILHLIAVSFDRYMAVVWRRKPMAHSTGVKRAVGFIASAWLSGILIGCLPLMGWNAGQSQSDGMQCEFLNVISMKYLMFLFYATIIAPTALMAFFYGSIYRAVRKQNEKMINIRCSMDSRASMCSNSVRQDTRRSTVDSSTALLRNQNDSGRSASAPILSVREIARQKRQNAKTKKIILSLLLVIICFFVSWYPLYVLNAIAYYCQTCQIEPWWFYGPIILSHMGSVMNPFIYARTMPGYREAFIQTITCGRIEAKSGNNVRKKNKADIITKFESKRGTTRKEHGFDNEDDVQYS